MVLFPSFQLMHLIIQYVNIGIIGNITFFF